MLKEFKAFALKGNALDMAVAFILGVSFQSVVKSIVDDLIMPITGVFTGGIDFTHKKIVLSKAVLEASGEVLKKENAITYGHFIETVVVFIIVSVVLFIIVKGFMKLHRKKKEEPAPPPPPTKEALLLEEIRDLLKQK